MSRANHRPTRPLDQYPDAAPVATLPPPPGAPGEDLGAPVAEAPTKARPAAILQFLDPAALQIEVPLAFPFRHEDREVRNLTVRRLAVAEVGAIMSSFGEDDAFDIWDFVGPMCGFDPAVVRSLIDDDGAEVLMRARPLLPRAARAMFGIAETAIPAQSASGPGGASP